jgi:hypothetical protein
MNRDSAVRNKRRRDDQKSYGDARFDSRLNGRIQQPRVLFEPRLLGKAVAAASISG